MANDGSIEISITGDADELKKEIEAVSKVTEKQTTQAQKSTKSVKSETDTLKKSLELMGKAGKTAYNSLKTTGEVAMKSIATAATASVSVMGGVATAAVNVGKSFESGMSTVASVSGATDAELEKLRTKAKEMGATTAFSATQATDAMNYMAMAGWKTNEMISGIDGIMNLAAASGADLATTSDIVTDALTAFGMTAKDSAEFADVMAAASSNANTNVELMGATFKYVGAAAGAMGYSIQDIAVATGLMANAGIKGEMAGTALRSTITRLAKPTKESQEAMDALGVSLTDSKGKMESFGEIMTDMRKGMSKMTEDEKASYAAMLGGQEAMSGLLAIANASDADFAKLTKAIEGSTGAAEKMAKVKLDNLEGDITILKSGLEGFGIQIYEEMQKPLRSAAQQATDMVSDLSKAFSKDGFEGVITEGGKIISNLLTVVAQKAPKITDVGFSFVDSIIKGIQQNSNKLTGTALLIVDKIADGIKTTSANLMPLVGDFANVFVQGVLKYKDVFWSVAFDMVTAIAQGLSDHADEISAGMITLINNIVAKMDESLPVFIEAASNLLINVFETLAENMPDIADNIFKMVSNIGETLLESLPMLFEAFSNLIVSVFEKLAENMPDIADDIARMITRICELLAKNLPKIIEAAGEFLEAFINQLLGHADEIFDSVSGVISSLFTSFTKLTPKVKTIVTLMAALYAAKGVANVLSAIANIQGKIKGLFSLISAHPIGLAVTAASALVGLIATATKAKKTEWDQHLKDIREENAKLSDEDNALCEKIKDAKEAFDDFKTSKDNAIDNSQTEWEYYQTLTGKLDTLVDRNGKIKTGQEDVVKAITEDLEKATGVKFEFKDGMIEHYQQTQEEIQKVLDKQKALALQSALVDSYTTANKNVSGAASRYAAAKSALDDQNAIIAEKQKAYDEAKSVYEKTKERFDKEEKSYKKYSNHTDDYKRHGEVLARMKEEMEEAQAALEGVKSVADGISNGENDLDLQVAFEDAEREYFEYLQTINQYEELYSAISSGNLDNINAVVKEINSHLIKAETGTKQQLEDQLTKAKSDLKYYREGLSNGLTGITEDTVKNAEDFVKQAKAELAKYNMQSVVDEYESTETRTKDSLKGQIGDMDSAINDLEKLIGTSDIDAEMVQKYKDTRIKAKSELDGMLIDYRKYLNDLSEEEKLNGYRKMYDKIMESYKNDTNLWRDSEQLGSDMLDGIIEGLNASSSQEDKTKAYMLGNFVKRQREMLGIHSPSKVTKEMLGEPMGQGVTVGNVEAIKEGAKDVEKAINDDLLKPLSKKSFSLSPNVILAAQQTARSTAQRAASSVTTTNIHNITNNAYQQTQQTSGDRYVQESIISFERGVNDLVDFLAPKIETRTRRVGRKAVAKLG